MSQPEDDRSRWEADVIASLRALELDDIPRLEFLLLTALVEWCFSDNNPGGEYSNQHAGETVSALLDAAKSARSVEGITAPDATADTTAARTKVLAGAHELADTAGGLTLLITRLMPAALGELTQHAGDPVTQVYSLCCYFMLALAGGRDGDVDETVLLGLISSYRSWESFMSGDAAPIGVGGTQGVQIGDLNVQHNTFVTQNVQTQVIQAPAVPVTWPVRAGDVPQEPPASISRAEQLTALGQLDRGAPIVRALIGPRGAGKTQLAAAYARSRMAEGWRLVAWINAEDTDEVVNGLGELAGKLGIRDVDEDLASAARAVRHWLEASGDRCLLVLDDVGDLDGLRPYVPVAGQAQIVITSTLQPTADLGLAVPVGMFDEESALAFLVERTHESNLTGAGELAAELGYLPLALAQAAAVIGRQRISYSVYLERLRALPISQYLARIEPDPYPRGTAATIVLSMDSVGARDASGLPGAILDLIAILSTAGINRKLLYLAGEAGAFERADTDIEIDSALAQLADGSLITFNIDGTRVSAHGLVMRVVRELRAQEGTLVAAGAAAVQVLHAMSAEVEPEWQNAVAARDLIQQVVALQAHIESLPSESTVELTPNLLLLRGRAITHLFRLGDNPAQEIELVQPLLADCELFLGADHPNTVRMRINLAAAYQRAGLANEAIKLGEQALADFERSLDGDDPTILTARNNLAYAYRLAGNLDEAIRLYESCLVERIQTCGEGHPDTILSRNNLADAYSDAGRLDEAINMFERNVADRERILGRSHPGTLTSLTNLAAAYVKDGQIDNAIDLFERTLSEQEKLQRGYHPDTLALRNNLARAYLEAGRAGEAIDLYEQLIIDCGRVLGLDPPNTRAVRENLAAAQQP